MASKAIFIIGPAGAGKTSSIRTLEPKTTFVINALGKELPFKGSGKLYTYWDKENNPSGNMVRTSHSKAIIDWLNAINTAKSLQHIKDVVIDDNTFVTSLELLRRTKETTWDKFNDIAQNFISLANTARSLRDDLVVYILHHTQTEGDGIIEEKQIRAMSYGKLIDEKLGTQEAQFTVVLRSAKEKTDNGIEYVFYTSDPNSTVKTPHGMFETDKIPNDLSVVRKAIDCYYNEDCEEEVIEKSKTKASKVS